ncbi:MAG: hypothetical protein KJ062_12330, partial [Thermoanaerobaculia bacterium]|nr:hypothetical protein [Thermoanaerobaculia bacterium]
GGGGARGGGGAAGAPAGAGGGPPRPAGVRCDVGAFEGAETPTAFHTVTPCRVLDTRLGAATPVAATGSLSFGAAGTCGVPADARALAVNLTVAAPQAGGVLRLWGAGGPPPTAQVLGFAAGKTRASSAIATPGALGRLTVRNDSAQPAHAILDVSGYFR